MTTASLHDHSAADHTPPPAQEPLHDRERSLTLRVNGMTCAGCAANVRRALEMQPGVESAAVSVTEARAIITGDALQAQPLIEAVEQRGFEASVLEEAPAADETLSEIEQRQTEHERAWKRRAVIGLGVWIPLEVMHWSMHALHVHTPWMPWVMLVGAAIVLATAGAGFYRSAWRAAVRRTTNMDTLISIGATTAFIFSLVVLIAQQFGAMLEQQLYFAESAALLGIISLGHWLEARSTAKAGSAVRELLELQPDKAEVIEKSKGRKVETPKSVEQNDLSTRLVASREVALGDLVLIRPGGRVPVDGEVIEGESEVDESIVTGEPLPVVKRSGDSLVAGSMNTTGRLVLRAATDGRHTTLTRIAEMVRNAQTSRADIQRLADRVSSIFVPAVLLIAVVTVAGWWLAGDLPKGIIAAVTVLIISCPCALGLATPMAVMVGAGAASKRGILIKSAAALETAGNATVIIFDKTGTLTIGQPVVTAIDVREGDADEASLLRMAAAVEMPSEHPIARAIVKAARERGIAVAAVDAFAALPGEGVRGNVDGREVRVVRDERTTCRVLRDGIELGTITVADAPREDAAQAIASLHGMGIRAHMLTGDREPAAQAIAAKLGFSERDAVIGDATPASKESYVAEAVREAHAQDGVVIMVGDGINDAAALARSDLGIAMASGTNIAIESADIVIPGEHLSAVPETIDLARKTLRTIKQNLFFAFAYNTAAIPAAALGLLGPYGPVIAAAAMGFSDVTVVGNALRLRRKLRRKAK